MRCIEGWWEYSSIYLSTDVTIRNNNLVKKIGKLQHI